MEDHNVRKSKAERRQQKKARRKFKIHGSSLRTIYQNAIRRRLRKKK